LNGCLIREPHLLSMTAFSSLRCPCRHKDTGGLNKKVLGATRGPISFLRRVQKNGTLRIASEFHFHGYAFDRNIGNAFCRSPVRN
jgi:hypothetical protein